MYMKRAISCNSFFKYTPLKPLICSYGRFLSYCSKNNILLTKNIRKHAMIMYLDNVRPLSFK